ncbi:MAG: hypothetical protein A2370_02045 [Candidatus Vogelbacteria bacterium RIFOXYB1_FULL_42_16]|uniref:Uncharacterized protein n=1 Tax=Candidatus Vogelbacteria bacterium RIFOXYB1_FULL_42_16 TaxID=1802436 RepID=A0A1G2QD36_9BACT|nr:MAG: hypothetical protein A2370_02045 [Candidatus Vogelbacteria bacterium RIFOXYB1_FULL_42_16]
MEEELSQAVCCGQLEKAEELAKRSGRNFLRYPDELRVIAAVAYLKGDMEMMRTMERRFSIILRSEEVEYLTERFKLQA